MKRENNHGEGGHVCPSFLQRKHNRKKVEVDYMVSPKGIASVEIVGENIILCRDDTKGELRILVGFGILAVIVIIVLIIKKFI